MMSRTDGSTADFGLHILPELV